MGSHSASILSSACKTHCVDLKNIAQTLTILHKHKLVYNKLLKLQHIPPMKVQCELLYFKNKSRKWLLRILTTAAVFSLVTLKMHSFNIKYSIFIFVSAYHFLLFADRECASHIVRT